MRTIPALPAWLTRRAILVIDDSVDFRRTVAGGLQDLGVRCYAAGTHNEGLRLVAQRPQIAVALVDFEMPDGPVERLVEQLHRVRPELIVVGNSARRLDSDPALLGIHQFLAKPWSWSQLLTVLSESEPATEKCSAAPEFCNSG